MKRRKLNKFEIKVIKVLLLLKIPSKFVAKLFNCSIKQIAGFKAWVFNPNSWDNISRSKKQLNT